MQNNQQVVIVGSGPTGAMAAYELINRGTPVVMLETGTHFESGLLLRIQGRNLYRIRPGVKGGKLALDSKIGVENGRLHTVSGDPRTVWWGAFMPGGFTNQWTGAVPRFSDEDFCEGHRLGEQYVWPVSYQDLVPYYQRVEPLMWINGDPQSRPNLPAGMPAYKSKLPQDWEQIARIAEQRGQGLAPTPLADGPPYLFVRRGTAFNSYTNIVQPLMRSPNFKLILGAHVLKLDYSSQSGKVNAVIYYDRQSQSQHRIQADAVVLAANALCSTKILFDSACKEFPEGLGNTEGVLGKYLHDHPRDWWTFTLDRPIHRPTPSVYLTRLPHSVSKPLIATSWTIGAYPTATERLLSLFPIKGTSFGVQVFGTMIPSEEHYVRPDFSKRDEHGLPVLNIKIHFDAETLKNVLDAREQLLDLLGEGGFPARLLETPTEFEPGSAVHYGGTIRMHTSPKYGMLDGWNRLHAVPNVIVADSSCFTTGCEKNPTLTAMALAARACHKLADTLKAG